MMRLFIAATLSETQVQSLIKSQAILEGSAIRLSATKPQNLHLTLQFIGEVEETVTDRLMKKLSELEVSEREKYRCRISRFGSFKRQGMHLVFARLETSTEAEELVHAIKQAIQSVGIKTDNKKWLPHVTIARRVELKPGIRELPQMISTEAFEPVSGVSLFLSEFSQSGMIYTPLMNIL